MTCSYGSKSFSASSSSSSSSGSSVSSASVTCSDVGLSGLAVAGGATCSSGFLQSFQAIAEGGSGNNQGNQGGSGNNQGNQGSGNNQGNQGNNQGSWGSGSSSGSGGSYTSGQYAVQGSGFSVVCATPDLSGYSSSSYGSTYQAPSPCLDEVTLVCCSY